MKTKEENINMAGSLAIILLSILLLGMGLLMLGFPNLKMIYFCYGVGGCLLIWGIWMISRYFLHKEFKKTTNYGFSIGTLIVILGAVSLIRAEDIALSVPMYLGMGILVEGVVMLQNTVQMKNLQGKCWWLNLVFSLSAVVASTVILMDINQVTTKQKGLVYACCIGAGVLTLCSLLLVACRTKRYGKEQQQLNERNLEDEVTWEETPEDVEAEQKEEDTNIDEME